jgi:hypothetical protein
VRRAAALILLAASACGQLSFVKDDRLRIVTPRDRALVHLPLRVSWSVEGFRVTGRTGAAERDAGLFGVFVDRAPVPPGETLESLARDDKMCGATPGCPDAAYLAGRDVYSTSERSFVVERLPDLGERGNRRDFHSLTIVLLNGKGERLGESAFRRDFQVRRDRT